MAINIFFLNTILIKVLLIEEYEKRASVNYLSDDWKTFFSFIIRYHRNIIVSVIEV